MPNFLTAFPRPRRGVMNGHFPGTNEMRNALCVVVGALAIAANAASAAEVTVMSGGAVKSALADAAAAWQKKSGHAVSAAYAPAGDLRKKIAAGERTDILVIPVENFAALEGEGAIDSSTRLAEKSKCVRS